MDPSIVIAAVSVATNIAMAFVSRGSQRNDKLEERVSGLESRMASQETHTQNFVRDMDEVKGQLKSISQKLDRALEK